MGIAEIIWALVAVVVVICALNKYEFGRVD
jgi:hypothetical protein